MLHTKRPIAHVHEGCAGPAPCSDGGARGSFYEGGRCCCAARPQGAP